MIDPRFKKTCFLCRQSFQFGGHIYDGKPVNAWKIIVCDICLKGNHDGIVPGTYPHLKSHLETLGVKPVINAKGWIEWPAGAFPMGV